MGNYTSPGGDDATEGVLTFHQVTRLDDVGVRMVDGHVEAERLQEHVLVEDEVLRLFQVRVPGDVLRARVQTRVHHLDHVLQLPGLLLDLTGQ